MPHSHINRAKSLKVRVVWALLGTSIVAVATIISLAVWMSAVANTIAAEKTKKRFFTALTAERDHLSILTEDYAHWTAAYDWVLAQDDDAVFENLGSSATDSLGFNLLYVFRTDGTPLYAYQSGGSASDTANVPDALKQRVVEMFAGQSVESYNVVHDLMAHDSAPAMIAATRLRPDDVTGMSVDDLFIMIVGVMLNDTWIETMEQRYLIEDLRLTTTPVSQADPESTSVLTMADGQVLGTMSWQPPHPGTLLLKEVAPFIAVISLALIFVSLQVGRISARQTALYLREHSLARTDGLTGFLNRAGLNEVVASASLHQSLARGEGAVIYLDLNGFKDINDQFGHDIGDTALEVLSKRIHAALRDKDHLARIGGDEFVCIVTARDPLPLARALAMRITTALESPLQLQGSEHVVGASIGIAIAEPGLRWATLIQRADAAMYHAKRKNIKAPVVFDKDIDESAAVMRSKKAA